MADEATRRDDDTEHRPARTGGGPALADEGDVAFGGMAGIGVIAAVIVSMLGLAGFFGYDAAKGDDHPETPAVAEHDDETEDSDHDDETEDSDHDDETEDSDHDDETEDSES